MSCPGDQLLHTYTARPASSPILLKILSTTDSTSTYINTAALPAPPHHVRCCQFRPQRPASQFSPIAKFVRSQQLIANTFLEKIFFAIVILGLSGHLVASQAYGGAPSVTNYEVFLGIWLIVVSIIGIVASKIELLAGPIGVGLEALTILFTFAGGTVCDQPPDPV